MQDSSVTLTTEQHSSSQTLSINSNSQNADPIAPIFNGQQADERILYVVTPHPLSFCFNLVKVIVVACLPYFGSLIHAKINRYVPSELQYISLSLSIILLVIGLWWINKLYTESKCYLTDRRIIRFKPMFPIFESKRGLFWNEVVKTKAYAPNIFYRILKIGKIEIAPTIVQQENIKLDWVYYFEDLGNYIDKILYCFKNKPQDMATIRAFVTKPKGQRY